MKNVVVSGATGVTGLALVRYLLDQGVSVTALIRPSSFRSKYLPLHEHLTVIDCDLSDLKHIVPSMPYNRYDAFFHLAWEGSTGENKIDNRNDMYLQNKNVEYSLDAVELCKNLGCPVFLATGSQAEYGRCNETITEETIEKPENGYGSAKLCAGQMTRIVCRNYGIKHVWARLFSIYGPYDYGTVNLIQSSVTKLINDERPIYTSGEQQWDYLFSYDAAKALYLLAEYGKDGQIYCVAQGSSMKLAEYIRIIHEEVNPSIQPIFGEIPYSHDQLMSLRADITKLRADTGFEPDYSFLKGIRLVRQWRVEEKVLSKHVTNKANADGGSN